MLEVPTPRRLDLVARYDDPNRSVHVEIADTGRGIPPEIQARIFEPFFTTKSDGEGTGLGLALTRGIIEGHGGAIRVESRPGDGARFHMELPVGTAPLIGEAPGPLDEAPPLPGKTILVVDDEPGVASILAEALTRDGYTVDTAPNGAVALEKLGAQTYDLIISDSGMPVVSGPELYREVERREPHLARRFVFVTGDILNPRTREFLERIDAPRLEKTFTLFRGLRRPTGPPPRPRRPRRRCAGAAPAGGTAIWSGGAPRPWLCFKAVLHRHGVDPARVTFVRDLSTPDAVAAFRAGKADFLEHGPPVVDELVADGAGHLVASMGEATGLVPFSSYMATPETLGREREAVGRFVRGLYRAQRWMAAATATEIAAVIAPAFADVDAGLRARAVERYLRQATWVGDPVLTRGGFEALQEILLGGGFIRRRQRFEDLVDTELAARVVGTIDGSTGSIRLP